MNEGDRLPASAGALLREARERQGLHIAALAAAIKVAPRKLDALENDRWHELPDATFARALAQTVCRTLKIDAHAVLERMPAVEQTGLENVAGTLNTPFRERGGSMDASNMGAAVRPMVWAGLALMVAAAAVYLLPADFWSGSDGQPSTSPAQAKLSPVAIPVAPFAAATSSVAVAVVETPPVFSAAASAPLVAAPDLTPPTSAAAAAAVLTAPTIAAASSPRSAGPPAADLIPVTSAGMAAAATAAATPAAAAQLHALQASWVEARDGLGKVLVSRQLAMGEKIELDGKLPLRLTIGNAGGTTLAFRGRPVDLAPITRGNVARLELQ